MADIADDADRVIEASIEQALSDARNSTPLAATGQCLAGCGAELPAGRRFCDASCRDVWQLQEDAKRRRGL